VDSRRSVVEYQGMSTAAGTEGSRVLVVDDDREVRRGLTLMLRRFGHVTDEAGDGAEALERMRAGSYDVIVSDIGMPNMSGIAFLRAVREQDLDVPVVFVTGDPTLDTAIDALEHGAYRYLTKPVSPEALRETVQRAVRMHRMAQLKREALELLGTDRMALGDRAALESRFESALKQMWLAFQPIVSWADRRIFGYEALVRSDEPALAGPAELFDAAERLGRLHELGRAIRSKAAEAERQAPPDALLFVNAHPEDLGDPALLDPDAPLSLIAARVVLEITERSALAGVRGLAERIAGLRKLGYRIAVDDFGAGYAGLTTFAQIEPELAKLDKALVAGLDCSPRKLSVVQAMLRLCGNDLGIQVVAEGVETEAERDALERAGCPLLQGFLFARPARGFVRPEL
jgi:EAL domain-containing protein (putative c-di-GMP-specific phosphodiesterase class I)